MTPEQSRAARGWLGWSQQELADRASVSLSTVRDFEKGRHAPIANNIAAIRRALEAGGIELVFDDNRQRAGMYGSLTQHPVGTELERESE